MGRANNVEHQPPACVLTIAGSDSGGSAGIQADLKTLTARGVFGTTVITLVTAQNTLGVRQVQAMPLEMIEAQMQAIVADITVDVIKTGLLLKPDVVERVADLLPDVPLIVDPVLVNGAGQRIVPLETVAAYQQHLIPRATVITPNLDEVALLTDTTRISSEAALEQAAKALHKLGAQYVLLKGGHLDGDVVVDIAFDGHSFRRWHKPRLPVENPHGVGCTFASAIAAEVAKGSPVIDAIEAAHDYLYRALQAAIPWHVGKGRSPVNHFVDL